MEDVNLQAQITGGPYQAIEVLTKSQGLNIILFHH